jgi:hypothetical protein
LLRTPRNSNDPTEESSPTVAEALFELNATLRDIRKGQEEMLDLMRASTALGVKRSYSAGQAQPDTHKKLRVDGPKRPSDKISAATYLLQSVEKDDTKTKREESVPPLICAHCGIEGHELADCQIPGPDGFVYGCPRHNTTEHSMDDCPEGWQWLSQRYTFLVSRRGCLPPILTSQYCWIVAKNETPEYRSRRSCFPWTSAFAKQMARDETYMARARTGTLLPERRRQCDPATRDWAAVQRLAETGRRQIFVPLSINLQDG